MFKAPAPPLPATTAAPPAPPMFGQDPKGKKPQAKASTPSFLGTQTLPGTANVSNKTLLGQ